MFILNRDHIPVKNGHAVKFGKRHCLDEIPQVECRCADPKCNRLFFIGNPDGPIYVKCVNCKTKNYFTKEP